MLIADYRFRVSDFMMRLLIWNLKSGIRTADQVFFNLKELGDLPGPVDRLMIEETESKDDAPCTSGSGSVSGSKKFLLAVTLIKDDPDSDPDPEYRARF